MWLHGVKPAVLETHVQAVHSAALWAESPLHPTSDVLPKCFWRLNAIHMELSSRVRGALHNDCPGKVNTDDGKFVLKARF